MIRKKLLLKISYPSNIQYRNVLKQKISSVGVVYFQI